MCFGGEAPVGDGMDFGVEGNMIDGLSGISLSDRDFVLCTAVR